MARHREAPDDARDARAASMLMEGPPGTSVTRPLPLRSITKHRSVAWQWMVGGQMHYPVPIGCSRPLSPFQNRP